MNTTLRLPFLLATLPPVVVTPPPVVVPPAELLPAAALATLPFPISPASTFSVLLDLVAGTVYDAALTLGPQTGGGGLGVHLVSPGNGKDYSYFKLSAGSGTYQLTPPYSGQFRFEVNSNGSSASLLAASLLVSTAAPVVTPAPTPAPDPTPVVTTPDPTPVVTTPTPVPTGASPLPSKVTVRATYAEAPTSPALTFADMFGDKNLCILGMKDDSAPGNVDIVFPALNGGVARDGKTYTAITYDDGTGKLVNPGYGFPEIGDAPTDAQWALKEKMYEADNFCPMNHTDKHTSYPDPLTRVTNCHNTILAKTGRTTRLYCPPTGEAGGLEPAITNLHYLGGISQSWYQTLPDGSSVGSAGSYQSEKIDGDFDIRQLKTHTHYLTERFYDQGAGGAEVWTIPNPVMDPWVDERVAAYAKDGRKLLASFFAHSPEESSQIEPFRAVYNRILAGAGERVWLPDPQTCFEYYETMRLAVVSAPRISGSVVEWDIDLSAIPAEARTHNMTPKFGGGTVTALEVGGVNEFGFSASKQFANLYRMVTKPTVTVLSGQPVSTVDADPFFARWESGTRQSGNVPYSGKRDVFFTNTIRRETGLAGLSDGTTNPNYDQSQLIIPADSNFELCLDVRKYRPKLTAARAYLRERSPIQVYYTAKGSHAKTLLGTLNTDQLPTQAGWVTLPFAVPTDVVKLFLVAPAGLYPSELELQGSWLEPEPFTRRTRTPKFSDLLGANDFVWDLLGRPDLLSCYSHIRHYIDVVTVNPFEGDYRFAPGWNGAGTWNYDVAYKGMKDRGIGIVGCIKTVQNFIYNTWPQDALNAVGGGAESIGVKWQGSLAATLEWSKQPAAYMEDGRVRFQYAARYGNQVVPSSLLHFHKDVEAQFTTADRTALGYVVAMEDKNEKDSWWHGLGGCAFGDQTAAALSCNYDGHMGTLGPDVGVKQADPSLPYSWAGQAVAQTDAMHQAKEWCRQYRGYLPDGRVNLCWDVANYHQYSNDGGSAQNNGQTTRGMAPEISGWQISQDDFMLFCDEHLYGMPVHMGEFGFDVSEFSDQAAVRPMDYARDTQGRIQLIRESNGVRTAADYNADGSRPGGTLLKLTAGPDRTTRLLVQAQWMLRSAAYLWYKGIEKAQVYMAPDAGGSEFDHYARCGMMDENGLRPSANAYYQALRLFGDYQLNRVVSTSPMVLEGVNSAGKLGYIGWSPTEAATTTQATLVLSGAYTRHEIDPNSATSVQKAVPAGTYAAVFTEMPSILLPA